MKRSAWLVAMTLAILPLQQPAAHAEDGRAPVTTTSYKSPGSVRICRPVCVRSARGQVKCSCG